MMFECPERQCSIIFVIFGATGDLTHRKLLPDNFAFDVAVKIRQDKSNTFKLGKKTIAAIRNEFGSHEVKK